MSKPIAYDSLLVRALAAELNARYARQRVRSVRYDPSDRMLRVFFRRVTLEWNLDPGGGGLVEIPAFGVPTGTQLPRGTTVTAVLVRPDDRVLDWVLHSPRAGALHLRIELLPNRRSAVLADDGGRPLVASTATAGATDSRPRQGAESVVSQADFVARLETVAPAERTRVLLAEFAFTSSINAAAILGPAASVPDPQAVAGAYARYAALVESPAAPVVLDAEGAAQPYPQPLPGVASTSCPSLLAAFAFARGQTGAPSEAALVESLAHRQKALEKRVARMREESMHAAGEAEELRRAATLLLSQLSAVRRGQREAVLDDWAGGTVRVALDPALDAAANANRLFDKARKRERAALRLPALMEKVAAEAGRLARTAEALTRGEIPAAEAASLLPEPTVRGEAQPVRLPFRRFRTSGGLEVRVGRNSKANDVLTLRHSSPEDIWMHARDAAGAHVVLRWPHRDENPPATDLVEAAVLAALHSRAATSGAVAVDWTRRKYVRKPRRAKPGLVRVERTRTLFVEPDPRVAERLRFD